MLLVLHKKGNHPTPGPLESISGNSRKAKILHRTRKPASKTTKSCSGGNHGNRTNSCPAMGGLGLGLGFLKYRTTLPPGTPKVGGVSRKREKEPTSSARLIITMLLYQGDKQHTVKALLDMGCSITLINQQTVEKLGIRCNCCNHPIQVESYTGEIVKGAGQLYTEPLRLQHRKHYTRESFGVSPMEAGINIFLPFQWITKHPLQGACTSNEVWFNSVSCLDDCSKFGTAEFSLTWDKSVVKDDTAHVIGHVSMANDDSLQNVPMEFRQYLGIMSKEATDRLPKHRLYDCKIELKEEATALWGPIYSLSELELQSLREWLKEMERTGKIQRSTSSAGSPILFVRKHGRVRAPTIRGLLKSKPSHHPEPVPPPAHAGTTRPSTGGPMVHQNGPQKRLQPNLNLRRRQMENRVPNSLRSIRISGDAIRPNQRTINLSGHDESCAFQPIGCGRGWAPRSRNPCSFPRLPSWHPRKRSENAVCFLPVSLLSFLWGTFYLLGTGLGGWQRKACNVPPSRGQWQGNGQKKCTLP